MRKGFRPVVLVTVAIVGGLVVGGSSARSGACAANQVAVDESGKERCVPASTLRASKPKVSRATSMIRDFLLDSPIPLRQKNGTIVEDVITPRLAVKVRNAYRADEARILAAFRKKLGTRTPSARTDDLRVTQLPDGSVSGTVGHTVTNGETSARMEIEVGARKQGDSFKLDVGLGVETDDGKGTKSGNKFQLKDMSKKAAPLCPSPTGEIDLDELYGAIVTESQTFGGARAHLGTVRKATHVSLGATAKAQLGPDARLQPYTMTVTASFDHVQSGQVLAFFQGRFRFVASGTFNGTVNPSTGSVSGGSMTTNGRVADGTVNAAERAEAEGKLRSSIEKMLKDANDRLLADLKKIESRARNGECTRIEFRPGSPSKLKPNASQDVDVQLVAKVLSGQSSREVPVKVGRWAATPAKGSVTPRTSNVARPTLAVKGASKGPQTAVINVKAVSPAGISQDSWIGTDKEEAGFPAAYAGTVTLSSNLQGAWVETWKANVTYTRKTQQTNPDGSKQAEYALTAASVPSHTGKGTCNWSTSDSKPTIKAGDLEIQVSAAGKWTSAFLVDLLLAQTQMTCPPAPAVPLKPKAFLNSRAKPSALRPMEPKGQIKASNVTDVNGIDPTASWDLDPKG